MKPMLLLATVLGLASACTAQRPARVQRPTISSAQTPDCNEIPTNTGKPMRCTAVPLTALRQ